MTDGSLKILSFRSRDPNFKTDLGVLPNDKLAKEKEDVDIVEADVATFRYERPRP